MLGIGISITGTAGPVGPSLPALTLTTAPAVSGDTLPSGTLTATAGVVAEAGVAVSRQWLRGGVPVSGQTGLTYAKSALDLDQSVVLAETYRLDGYAPLAAFSNAILVTPTNIAWNISGSVIEAAPLPPQPPRVTGTMIEA